jgi:hypothetical protein
VIVGNGDIASVLPERDDLLFFASGVSNSRETRESEYEREEILLREQEAQHIVYISSLSVFYSNTRYARHKRHMESEIRKFPVHTILRIGNISWGTNPHTLINHFRNQVKKGEHLDIQDTYRYIVDKEEFLHWVSLIPEWSCEINIPGRKLKVKEVVDEYVYVGLPV